MTAEMLQIIAQQALVELEVCDIFAPVRRHHRQGLTSVFLEGEREDGYKSPGLGNRDQYIPQPTIRNRRSGCGGMDSGKEAHC